METRPGYWDVESCRWVDGGPSHVVPPATLPVAAEPALAVAADETPGGALPSPRPEPVPAHDTEPATT